MKSAGLPSTHRKMMKQAKKVNVFAAQEQTRLAAREKLKAMRMQAERFSHERQRKEKELLSEKPTAPTAE